MGRTMDRKSEEAFEERIRKAYTSILNNLILRLLLPFFFKTADEADRGFRSDLPVHGTALLMYK